MLRLSRLTDYAVVVMAQLTRAMETPGIVVTATDLSEQTGVPAPTASKVLKLLARQGLVRSHRGVSGGYSASRTAEEVTLTEIISAIDGPVALTACVDGAVGQCIAESVCPVHGRWDRVNTVIKAALDGISLAELTPPTATFPVAAEHATSPETAKTTKDFEHA